MFLYSSDYIHLIGLIDFLFLLCLCILKTSKSNNNSLRGPFSTKWKHKLNCLVWIWIIKMCIYRFIMSGTWLLNNVLLNQYFYSIGLYLINLPFYPSGEHCGTTKLKCFKPCIFINADKDADCYYCVLGCVLCLLRKRN